MDWYPDPADPTRERYWDGERWTHNTREVQAMPAPAQPASDPWAAQQGPAGQPQGGGYGPYQGGTPQSGAPAANPYATNPYGTEPAGKQTHTADGVALAGWWSRAFAWIIDSIITTTVASLLGMNFVRQLTDGFTKLWQDMLQIAESGGTMPAGDIATLEKYGLVQPMYALQAIGVAVLFGYLLLCWKFMGATLAQRMLGLRVVPVDEGRAPRPLSWGRSIVRALVLTFSGMVWFVQLISFLMPLGTRRRQTLHDLAARTQVVRGR